MAKTVNERRAETSERTMSGIFGQCPVGPDKVRWDVSGADFSSSDKVRDFWTKSGGRSREQIFPPKIRPFLPKLDS
jgi:hypothetical protein